MGSTSAAKPGGPSPQSRPSAKKSAAPAAAAAEPDSENPKHQHPESPHRPNGTDACRAATETACAERLPSRDSIPGGDDPLSRSSALTRVEVLRRRSLRARAFARELQDQYWAAMEVLRVKVRDYYWKFGVSPVEGEKGDANVPRAVMENGGGFEGEVDHERHLGFGGVGNGGTKITGKRKHDVEVPGCVFAGCKGKAMPLTSYCPRHIISDPNQTLYKACIWVVKKKSAQSGPVICGKPVLRAAVPSFCSVHLEKSEKHVSQALKKFGLNTTASSPKLHVIVSEYVNQIQAKRKESQIQAKSIVPNMTGCSMEKEKKSG